MRRFRLLTIVPFVLAAVLVPGAAHPAAKATALSGTVGPGFSIALRDANGVRVSRLDPGDYTITIDDKSDQHNFHLRGPGSVDKATSLDAVQKVTWDVTLVDGIYNFRCDAHNTMRGSFRVGAAPPPLPKLTGRVIGKTITLKNAAGRLVKVIPQGKYKIVVKDLTRADNFHLKGPTANKRTGIRFKGTRSWTLALGQGSYTYRSDAHRKMRKTFKVIKPPTP